LRRRRTRFSLELMNGFPAQDEYDVVVMGGGSAGYAAARSAGSAGLRVLLADGATELGGLCILRGCMPSKSLLWAAEVRHLARSSGPLGLDIAHVDFNWSEVMDRKDALIREFADYRIQQLKNGPFEFAHAFARFLGPHELELSNGRRVRALHVIIATGSKPAPPPIPALGRIGAISSDDLIHLRKLPRSIIILGGGAIALEFAQLLARFDVEVTLIQRSQRLLSGFDPDLSGVAEQVLTDEGIRVFTGTELVDARIEGDSKVIVFRHNGTPTEARASEVLLALGRSPNTQSLNVAAAGVACSPQGRISADGRLRSTAPHIFAAGDCTGPHDIVHVAIQQAEIAAHNIARPDDPREFDPRLLIQVIFTDPQIACVGLSEREATARGISAISARYPFNDHGKSLIMQATRGFVKLLASPQTGEILGGACAGPVGGELIHEIVAAMFKRMTAQELAAMPHYHPTLAEIWTYPAEELAGQVAAK
jgi:pyruvate/2-oxoglutarate dehydrogenase complex dihydrolipoamide dehydrogenase (E3) component